MVNGISWMQFRVTKVIVSLNWISFGRTYLRNLSWQGGCRLRLYLTPPEFSRPTSDLLNFEAEFWFLRLVLYKLSFIFI